MRHHKQKIDLILLSPRDSTEAGSPPKTCVLPGEEVRVIVRVTGDPDDKVCGATAKLVCQETWMEYCSYANTPADMPYANNTPLTVAAEVPVGAPGEAIGEGDHTVILVVPADALPSAQSHDFWDKAVDWWVEVAINRRHGLDPTARGSLTVAASAERDRAEAQREPMVVGAPFFEVRPTTRSVRSGGVVTGSVVIAAPKDITVESLEVFLVLRRIDGPDLRRGVATLTWDKTNIFGETSLATALSMRAGAAKELPFELQLPANATPTLHTQHCWLAWGLEAGGRQSADTSKAAIELPLQVHNDPRTTG